MRRLLLLVALAGCARREEPPAPPSAPTISSAAPSVPEPPEDPAVARFRARALYESGQLALAAAAFESLLGARDPRDAVGRALALVLQGQADEALAAVAQAKAAGVSAPALDYAAGHAARARADRPAALRAFEAAAAAAPDAPEAAYWLGVARDEAGDAAGAVAALKPLADAGDGLGTVHYLPATYRVGRLLGRLGRRDEGAAILERYQTLFRDLGQPSLADEVLFHGRLTVVDVSPPPAPALAPAAPLRFAPEAAGEVGGPPAVAWLEGPEATPTVLWPRAGEVRAWKPGTPPRTLFTGARPIRAVVPADLDGDGDTDLFLAREAQDAALVQSDGAYRPVDLGPPGGSTGALAIDLDHDADLDLVTLGPGRFLRAAGPGPGPLAVRFEVVDVGLPASAQTGVAIDADDDGALDLLLLGAGADLLRNRRKGPLARVPLPALAGAESVAAEDFDADGRTDLLFVRAGRAALARNLGGTFEAPRDLGPAAGAVVGGDLDGDGRLDAVAGAAFTAGLVRAEVPGLEGARVAADVDGDGDLDLVAAGMLLRNDGPKSPTLAVIPQGTTSNKAGAGVVVEIQAGRTYVRRLGTGAPVLVGLSGRDKADVVRLRWPTGAYQTLLDVPGGRVVAKEPAGLLGSCPFLYVWNGDRFQYHGDFLGQAPIGIAVAPGKMIEPDIDEPLIIRGEDLRLKDGLIEIRMKEEFREVTYLDSIALYAIDSPIDAHVVADGRCKAPPFPDRELYASARARPPRAARDQDGRDVLALVLERDERAVRSFATTRLPGVVTPHSLELDLGPLVPGDRPVLYLDGWTFWAGANTLAALAQDPDGRADFPPRVEVPDGQGGWRTAVPDMGFPAGVTVRGIPVPLAGLVSLEDPRVRISTGLHVSWDRALVGLDGGDLPVTRTPVPLRSADLRFRGIATLVRTGAGEDGPALWDYDRLLDPLALRWGQLPGGHTPYGDARALVADPDDRFVTLDAGDELAATFDPAGLPAPPAGHRRDWLFVSSGWDKDANFHTGASQSVGPLPFRGMPTYPYGAEVDRAPSAGPRPARALLPDLRLRALDARTW